MDWGLREESSNIESLIAITLRERGKSEKELIQYGECDKNTGGIFSSGYTYFRLDIQMRFLPGIWKCKFGGASGLAL